MSDKILISKDNVELILTQVAKILYSQINANALDLSSYKDKLQILNYIVTNGNGTNILADDGNYKSKQASVITDIYTRSNTVYSTLKIIPYNSTYIPNIPEYQNLATKLAIIVNNGDGTKLLNDKGVYVDVNIYRGLTTTEITDVCNQIKGGY